MARKPSTTAPSTAQNRSRATGRVGQRATESRPRREHERHETQEAGIVRCIGEEVEVSWQEDVQRSRARPSVPRAREEVEVSWQEDVQAIGERLGVPGSRPRWELLQPSRPPAWRRLR
jgi:hypothetical protein